MQEVLKKIDTLYSLLKEKIETVDAMSKMLKGDFKAMADKEAKIEAAKNFIAVAQRKLKSQEDVEVQKSKLSVEMRNIATTKAVLDKRERSLNASEKLTAQNELELQKMIGVYKVKHDNLAKKEAALEVAKKNMKAKILEELGKKV